jgi:hypothetical protein
MGQRQQREQHIREVASEIIDGMMRRDPEQFKTKPGLDLGHESSGGVGDMKAISPDLLATIGGAADAASTYAFLKRGTGTEGNAMLKGTNNHPEATALAALGGLAATKALTKLIKRVSPRAADALAANLGNLQLGYAVGNLSLENEGASSRYQRTMQADAVERARRQRP